jgi:DNA-directed RNA polymerase subunit RPC12/RpoP
MTTCKACGQKFPSPIQMDKASFDDPSNRLENNSYQCPHCGESRGYDKSDLFWE